MNEIYLIMPGNISSRLHSMIEAALSETVPVVIDSISKLPDLRGKKILFAVELNNAGFNIPLLEIFEKLYERGEDALSGSTGAILVRSCTELFTKSASQNIILLANRLGCRFPGHPVVEATSTLENFRSWQKQMDMPLEDICIEMARRLGKRLAEENPMPVGTPKILVLHSSNRDTSNTLELWHMASKHIPSDYIKDLHVENGKVLDCKGCSYKTCIHYSQQNSCFYGGVMVKEVFPAIEKANAVIWICPNYNDALSANLTAVINRLTALYRKAAFYNKTIFSVIVSGNSGSDSVAKQLIGSLNINKGFRLPPYFSIMATANDAGRIRQVPGIEDRARCFAENMLNEIKI